MSPHHKINIFQSKKVQKKLFELPCNIEYIDKLDTSGDTLYYIEKLLLKFVCNAP